MFSHLCSYVAAKMLLLFVNTNNFSEQKNQRFMIISSGVFKQIFIFLGTSDILEYLFKNKTFSTTHQNITKVQTQSKLHCKGLYYNKYYSCVSDR